MILWGKLMLMFLKSNDKSKGINCAKRMQQFRSHFLFSKIHKKIIKIISLKKDEQICVFIFKKNKGLDFS